MYPTGAVWSKVITLLEVDELPALSVTVSTTFLEPSFEARVMSIAFNAVDETCVASPETTYVAIPLPASVAVAVKLTAVLLVAEARENGVREGATVS